MRKLISAAAISLAASVIVVGTAPAATAVNPTNKGVELAQAIVAKYNKTPTSIGITTALTEVPPAGKSVVAISNGGDENKVLDEAIARAAKSLKWKYRELVGAVSPETQRSIFSQALALNPDYIHVSGIEPSTLSDLLVKAKKDGVVVVCSACMSKPVSAMENTSISGPKMLDRWGQIIAAYVVASTKGNAKVQGVTVPLYPILARFDTAFEKNLNKLSPTSTYKANPQQLTDIFAGKTPQAVVNIVASNPGTNWIVSDLGGWVTGVSAALKNPAIQIGGLTAGKANIQSLKEGAESAWTGYSLPIVGYSVVDQMARHSIGMAYNIGDLPTQVLTKQNAKSLVLTPAGDYLGVKNYESDFRKLWGVK